jgi:glycine/D-amino acid oxidase-like deaminating enzyme
MLPNLSPWLHQLKRTRPSAQLLHNKHTPVAIVGGGIAGVMTAYFTLKNTNHNVVIVEATKIAHGATGHNAGQLVSYFERSFTDLCREFGVELASAGQSAVESAWVLLEEVLQDTKLATPLFQFTGYAGCKDLAEVLVHLEDNWWRKKGGLPLEKMFIASEAPYLKQLPAKYDTLYSVVPHKNITALLETKDASYTATLASRKGCMNSALFCEELVRYMIAQFGDRFTVYEHSPIHQVVLYKNHANLVGDTYTIFADQVVLCTNGFEHFTIENKSGGDIDGKFHHLVRGAVGYMAGFLAPLDKSPTAVSYLPKHKDNASPEYTGEPYFYLTRRPFELEKNEKHNLICIGGPETVMDDTNKYHKEHPYPEEAQRAIDEFVRTTYKDSPKKIEYAFQWHGLMGYTPNGVRCVGFEPCNKVLLYNLGCNGIGILPSIYSGKRIADLLDNKHLPPSIFDPQDRRCVIKKK